MESTRDRTNRSAGNGNALHQDQHKLYLSMAKTGSTLGTITMLELRERAGEIVTRVGRGETLVLTYRGRPAIRLVPLGREVPAQGDAFYRLADSADRRASSLTNRQIDEIVYGP